MGRSDLVVESIERATRLSPLDPLGYLFKTGLALAYGAADRHSEAMDWIDGSLRDQPRWVPSINFKIALCELLGRDVERKEWIARLLELVPDATIARLDAGVSNWMSPAIRAIFTASLRKARLPEE